MWSSCVRARITAQFQPPVIRMLTAFLSLARARARERPALTVCAQVVERKDPSEKPGAGGLEGGGLQEGQRFITDQTELPPRSEL